jgi:hypothetical protein
MPRGQKFCHGETIRAIIRDVKPDLTLVSGNLGELLKQMWDSDFAERPKMAEVVALLSLKKYWVPDTDEAQFLEYIEFVDREESHLVVQPQVDWSTFLRESESVKELTAKMTEGESERSLTRSFSRAVAILSSGEEEAEKDLMEKLNNWLHRNGWLVTRKVLEQVAKSTNDKKFREGRSLDQ